jgi:type VI protein secretion system component VasK
MQAKLIRIAIVAVAALVAAVFLIATGAFLCVALYEGLKIVWAPWLAALASAAILLVVAWIVVAIGAAIGRAAERKARREAESEGFRHRQDRAGDRPHPGRKRLRLHRQEPHQGAAGGLAVGFLLGAVPKLRSFLMSS